MLTRRGFFGLVAGALAHEATRKTIYVLPPLGGWQCKSGLITPGEALFFLPPDIEARWTYHYTYRNVLTGHVSDATPDVRKLAHTFGYPELDVLDIYRVKDNGEFDYEVTLGAILS